MHLGGKDIYFGFGGGGEILILGKIYTPGYVNLKSLVTHRSHKLLHVGLKLFFVLVRVKANVVANLAAQLLQDPRLVVVCLHQLVVQGQQLQEPWHPGGHVVLEKLGQILTDIKFWLFLFSKRHILLCYSFIRNFRYL